MCDSFLVGMGGLNLKYTKTFRGQVSLGNPSGPNNPEPNPVQLSVEKVSTTGKLLQYETFKSLVESSLNDNCFL
jgi:hypothetical protein